MKVILQKDVPNLGDAGEIKSVADGYARNFLIPHKLVIPAHAGSQRALAHQKRLMQLKSERREKEMSAVADRLKDVGSVDVTVLVGANDKMYGSVTTLHIAQALQKKDFAVDKRKIELGDKIRSPGTYTFKVKLAEKISVPLSLNVIAEQASDAEEEEAQATDREEDVDSESADANADDQESTDA